MSTKYLARTVIEGGRRRRNRWQRRYTHKEERAAEQQVSSRVARRQELDDVLYEPRRPLWREFNDKLGPDADKRPALDGAEDHDGDLGTGGEVPIGAQCCAATGRLHARGPVGLDGLTSYKYILRGSGQLAHDYQGPHAKPFTHKRLRSCDSDDKRAN